MVRNLLKLVLTKDYASKGVAGAGLGLGIAGTALWLLSGGLGGGLFGNRFGAAGAAALGAESTVEKEDKCELVNGMWQLAFNGQTARFNDRNQINAEMFGIYKSQFDFYSCCIVDSSHIFLYGGNTLSFNLKYFPLFY